MTGTELGKWITIELEDDDLPSMGELLRVRRQNLCECLAYFDDDRQRGFESYGIVPRWWTDQDTGQPLSDVTHWYQIVIPTRKEYRNGVSYDEMYQEYKKKSGEGKAKPCARDESQAQETENSCARTERY